MNKTENRRCCDTKPPDNGVSEPLRPLRVGKAIDLYQYRCKSTKPCIPYDLHILFPRASHRAELIIDEVEVREDRILQDVSGDLPLTRNCLKLSGVNLHVLRDHLLNERRGFGDRAEFIALKLARAECLRQLQHGVFLLLYPRAADDK